MTQTFLWATKQFSPPLKSRYGACRNALDALTGIREELFALIGR